MANLTLAIEHDPLKEACKLAVDQDTTVNQMVREFLEAQVRQASKRQSAKVRLLRYRFSAVPITRTRDELYER